MFFDAAAYDSVPHQLCLFQIRRLIDELSLDGEEFHARQEDRIKIVAFYHYVKQDLFSSAMEYYGRRIEVHNCVPQGSYISPMLYAVATNSLEVKIPTF